MTTATDQPITRQELLAVTELILDYHQPLVRGNENLLRALKQRLRTLLMGEQPAAAPPANRATS